METLEIKLFIYSFIILILSGKSLALPLNDSYYHCKTLYPNKSVTGLGVNPGYGWDNLQNKQKGIVAATTYSLCRVTSDERFYIPDEVIVIPFQKTNIEQEGEFFSHWKDYISITSRSINAKMGFSMNNPLLSISASFSSDYEYVKTNQVKDDSVTTRVSMSYLHYKLMENADFELDLTFKNRLFDIAYQIQVENIAMAEYLSEILIRDYGTHIVTAINVGATLMKEDHVRRSFIENKEHTGKSISFAAGVSFKKQFNLAVSFQNKNEEDFYESYSSNITSSRVQTFGGPYFKISSNIADWEKDIEYFLTTIDREGYPLHHVINSRTVSELELSTILKLSQMVEQIIERYYKYNVHAGCTKRESPNFYFQANIDDNTCESPSNNFTFAGLYQTCDKNQWFESKKDLCKKFRQINPLVGGYSCPNGFKSQLLFTTVLTHETETSCSITCRTFLGIKYHCRKNCYDYQPTSDISTYWCYSDSIVKPDSGLLFGGVYTSNVPNILTQDKSCPPYFNALKFGRNMHICISDDYELGYSNSIPFGGLFSCQNRNPLANTNSSTLFQNCPNGHSHHLLEIENGCEIEFCVKVKSFTHDFKLPPIVLPPFTKPSNTINKDAIQILLMAGNKYLKKYISDDEWNFVPTDDVTLIVPSPTSNNSFSNNGLIIGLPILAVFIIIAGIIGFIKYKQKRKLSTLNSIDINKAEAVSETSPLLRSS